MSSPNRVPQASANRREFLKAAGAATVGMGLAPAILGAADKSGRRRPILGSGEHTYEAIHGWGELPKHIVWGDTHGVCIDEEGLIYIKHRSSAKEPMDAIVVFDEDGRYVRSFGKEYHGGGHGIDVRTEGGEQFLYLSDIRNRLVAKTSLKGELVWKRTFPKESGVYKNAGGYRPTNVAFAPDGGVYVGDGYGSHYIHKYDADGTYRFTFGGPGSEPGKLKTPHGLWLDNRPGRQPALVVADRANFRLQYFDFDGKPLGFVMDVLFPADIDIQGEVMLVPDLHARVSLFDRDNKAIVHLGYDADWTKQVLADRMAMRRHPEKWPAGRFIHPHDACFDRAGNIYVVEWVPTGRVTKLRKVS